MNRLCLILALVFSTIACIKVQTEDLKQKRAPWTTSKLVGSPEPPHPYRLDRVFPKLAFNNPLLMTNAPGSKRLFIGEQEGRLYSFMPDPDCAKPDMFFDLRKDLHSWNAKQDVKGIAAVYGLSFHPNFVTNRYCYICYVLDSKSGKPLADGSRVSRFRVTDSNPPRVDPASEQIVLTFLAGGHNGGCLVFGPDGCLYISTGDAADPNPPDRLDTGQDCSDLLSSILRIDVDHPEPGKAYAVPKDNPFVGRDDIRPEIWSYGFRNPWKMTFDRQTGDLWVGDVGWELWEMIFRVTKGGNYGWSVMEGRQAVRPNSRRGPTPILPPTLDFPHTEAASITGGYVYRGKKFPDLFGAYICGDWVTRKVWGTRFAGDKIVSHRELAQGIPKVVAFCEDNDGELYIVHYDGNGTIHQLVPNKEHADTSASFPRRLSETGLYTSVAKQEASPGVIPFDPIAKQWLDHAQATYLCALPGTSAITVYDEPKNIPGGFYSARVFFPTNGVLAKTISLEMVAGDPKTRRMVETQILHYDGETWHGYSYAWNDEQTDAVLMPASGGDKTLSVVDVNYPGGKRLQNWHFPSRAECMTCHNGWTGGTLAFTVPQLDHDATVLGKQGNQLNLLQDAGFIIPATMKPHQRAVLRAGKDRLCDPRETKKDVASRARSYLHVNCAHCHQFGAGGTADIELRAETALDKTKLLGKKPVQGSFEIPDAALVNPGDPYRSVLYCRMAKSGGGRMPHIGSEIVDEQGLKLVRDWITSLPTTNNAAPKTQVSEEILWQKHLKQLGTLELGQEGDRLIADILRSTPQALRLSAMFNELAPTTRERVLTKAMAKPESHIRDLFERFLPDAARPRRLGASIRPEQILSLMGDEGRGKELVHKHATLQCLTCHQIAGQGKLVGPDLSHIATKLKPDALLESLLDPSKTIDAAFVQSVVEMRDGRLLSGIVAKRDANELLLRDAQGKETRLAAKEIESATAMTKSLMPEQMLRDLTAQQAADLLAYLKSLR